MKWPTPRRHKAMENVMEREKDAVCVLIDAENVSARYVQVIFDELEKYGFASCRRNLRQTGPKSLAGRKIFCWSIR